MNEYDSGKMRDVLEAAHGMTRTDNPAEADVLLVNTCSVREKAQEKVFSLLGEWRLFKQQRPHVVIGVGLRVVIFGFEDNPRYPEADSVPFTVLINPALTPLGGEEDEGWEGCLSVPGMRGLVPRYRHLRYTGVDAAGVALDRTVSDFHARVVQHEVDHLDGILYPRRIRDLTMFGFNEALFPGEDLTDD